MKGNDNANAKEQPTGIATPAVALSLDHSRASFYTGATDHYFGCPYHDHWSARVEQSNDLPRFDLELAPSAYVQPKASPAQITEACN